MQADIQKFKDIGDASRIAMILQVNARNPIRLYWEQADASVRSLANWFSLGDLAGDKTREEMSVPEGEAYDNLLRDLTNVRAKTQKFWMKPNFSGKHPVDKRCCGNYGVQQHRAVRTGTPLLKTIQSWQQYGMSGGEHPLQHHKSVGQRWRHGKDFRHERSRGCRGTDWSMQNIFSGILNDLLQNMADGFKKMEVSDPSSLTDFIEATSGSILSIISVRHLSSLNCWEPSL